MMTTFTGAKRPSRKRKKKVASFSHFCLIMSWTSLWQKVTSTVVETVAPLIQTNLEQLQSTWRKIDQECMQMLQSEDESPSTYHLD
jgi:hypothetical protein